MRIILAVLLVVFSISTKAQITFQKTFGGTNFDKGYSVKQTTDGGYIIAGTTNSFGAGASDVYLIKTDSIGDTLWTKTYGGINDDVGNSVQQTTDGGFIIVGNTTSFGVGIKNAYLIKTDSIGGILWTKTYGGQDTEDARSVQQTTDGGYIITGNTTSFGVGFRNVYLIKTDVSGNTLWTKTFGGTDYDFGYSVKQTMDGGYIVAGNTSSFGAFGYYYVYLIKTDSIGDTLWSKTFSIITSDVVCSVQQTTDSGYIIAGESFNSASKSSAIYLIKTDGIGDTLWTKNFGGAIRQGCNSVQQTIDGGYIISGNPYDFPGADLIKTDSSGNVLWSKTFGGGDDASFSGEQTKDGGYIITGWTRSFGAVDGDIYLIKTDSNGNSGCNEINPATSTFILYTLVTNPVTIVTTSPTVITTPTTIISSGAIVITLCTSIGIGEIDDNNYSLLIYPNPATNTFTIKNIYPKEKTLVKIINVFNEIVYTKMFYDKYDYIVDANFTKGIYFVCISNKENLVVRKLIIE